MPEDSLTNPVCAEKIENGQRRRHDRVGRTDLLVLAPKGSEMGNEYDQQQKGAISERVSEHGPLPFGGEDNLRMTN